MIEKFIYVKYIFHARYKFGIVFFGDAPVVIAVRSKFIFFNALRIASRLTGVSRTTLDCSSKSRMVQRECPCGAGPHASSMIRASARPSSFLLAWSELTLRRYCKTDERPPLIYFVTVLATVAIQTPFPLAHCSCVRTLL